LDLSSDMVRSLVGGMGLPLEAIYGIFGVTKNFNGLSVRPLV
ncbi:hypothetical protein RRG08_000405, partial [Elysia crispata]